MPISIYDLRRQLASRAKRLAKLADENVARGGSGDTIVICEIALILETGLALYGQKLDEELAKRKLIRDRKTKGLCERCGIMRAEDSLCFTCEQAERKNLLALGVPPELLE